MLNLISITKHMVFYLI